MEPLKTSIQSSDRLISSTSKQPLLIESHSEGILTCSLLSLYKELRGIKQQYYQNCVTQLGKPLFIYNQLQPKYITALIKYTGVEEYSELLDYFSAYDIEEKHAIIFSPNHLSKTKRNQELDFVKRVNKAFDDTCFIKLPLHTVKDYLEYAEHEKSPLLVLPKKDLNTFLHYIATDKSHKVKVAAAFE